MVPEPLFDRNLLDARKARAALALARTGTAPDFLLERVAGDLLWRLGTVKRTFAVAANLGAWHGLVGQRLRGLPGLGTLIEVERCAAFLPRLRARASGVVVVAGEEALPFADGSLDLVVSALCLHWVNDLPGTLVQIRRALKPDGLLIAALLGGRTLHELRQSFLLAETEVEGGASPRVAPFADVRDLGALLQRAKFALPVTDVDTIQVSYADPLALLHELRAMGATNVLVARRRTPLRRATLLRALEIYRQRFALPNGRVRATFEVVTLTGWAPHESQQQPLRPGTARTRLADALGTREQATGEAAAPRPGKP